MTLGASAQAIARALLSTLTDATHLGDWSAPGRVNLIGEHTDYNDGYVLPFAIDYRTYVAVAPRNDATIRVASDFSSDVVETSLADLPNRFPNDCSPDWAAYPLGVAWAMVRASGVDITTLRGLDLAVASEVSVGAGLSSSAAIEGATASALNDIWGLGFDRVELARIGRIAENDAVGAPTGIMDQMASMLGRPDAAIFLDCRSLETEIVTLGFATSGLELLVIDTNVKHSHATGGYRERRASCEKAAAIMGIASLRELHLDDLERAEQLMDDVTFRRARHIVTENQRVLDTVRVLHVDGPHAIGDLMLSSHASMRDDFEISVRELDVAVEAAVSGGAIGARMTGGGFGGAAIALVDRAKLEVVKDAVTAAFMTSDFDAPTLFTVAPSEGARRDA